MGNGEVIMLSPKCWSGHNSGGASACAKLWVHGEAVRPRKPQPRAKNLARKGPHLYIRNIPYGASTLHSPCRHGQKQCGLPWCPNEVCKTEQLCLKCHVSSAHHLLSSLLMIGWLGSPQWIIIIPIQPLSVIPLTIKLQGSAWHCSIAAFQYKSLCACLVGGFASSLQCPMIGKHQTFEASTQFFLRWHWVSLPVLVG